MPAYAQLVRQVREAMRLGLLRPGDRLPTVREVVTSCTVNAATVLKAYRELEMSGLVESRQGSGTFVTATLGSADPHVWPGCAPACALAGPGARGWARRRGRPGTGDLRARPDRRRARAARRRAPGSARREGEPTALEARGLTKQYRDVAALSECSFQLPAHCIIALVGANGAGKSTLMSIAAGLLPATSGEILVADGASTPAARPARRAQHTASPSSPRTSRCIASSPSPTCSLRAAHQPRLGPAARAVMAGALRRPARAPLRPAVRRAARPGRPRGRTRQLPGSAAAGRAAGEPGPGRAQRGHRGADSRGRGERDDRDALDPIVAELAGVGEYLLLLAAGRPVLAGDIEELVASHVRLTGPRADLPPCPGEIVQAQHAERQSTFIVRLPGQPAPDSRPRVEQRADHLRGTDASPISSRPRSPAVSWRPPHERT